jgi:hypothetical protein
VVVDMAITYDAGTNTITVVGTGYSYSDIYDADVAGGWGVVSKQGDKQYHLLCNLVIGDGSTTTSVSDTDVQIEIGSDATENWFQVKAEATHTIGELNQLGYELEYGRLGNSFVVWFTRDEGYVDSEGKFNFFGCYIENAKPNSIQWRITAAGEVDIRNCVISGEGDIFFARCSGQILRTNFSVRQSYGFMCYTDGLTLEDVYCDNYVQGLTCGYGGVAVKATNCTIRDGNYDRAIVMNPYNNTTFEIIDCDYDIYHIRSMIAFNQENPPAILDDYKTFNLKVTDIDGNAMESVNVKITDVFGTEIEVQTDENGEIEEQQLHNFNCRNNQEVGTGIGTEYNDYIFYTPYSIEISKNGYTAQNLKIDLTEDKYKKGIQFQITLEVPEVLTYEGLDVSITEDNIQVSIGG